MAPAYSKNPPAVTGKRKRATISYAEVDDIDDFLSDSQDVEPADKPDLSDSDDDETFSTRRKASPSM